MEVLVTASEPGGEGRRLATELGAVCVEDRAAPATVADVDAVVVGADAISTDAFVNKAGTRVLGEAANRVGTPFFVVAESYKWLPDTKSITAGGAFETIPNALVTDFLSDGTFRVVTPGRVTRPLPSALPKCRSTCRQPPSGSRYRP